jgi:acyl-CoA thioesterase-2
MKEVRELLELLDLEQIEYNIFRAGVSQSMGSPRVFGGQVLAQALNAASRTVGADRYVHSLHAYFILPGDLNMPILFTVERTRDGGSFTTRNIHAVQHGKSIFNMIASFQLEQEGYSHQIEMPDDIPPPESLLSWDDIREKFGDHLPGQYKMWLEIERPIEFKPVELNNPMERKKQKPFRHIWMRAKGDMTDNKAAHQQVLAYASDYNLLAAALLPHGDSARIGDVKMASLDHAMWFHRSFSMNEWLLYAIDSPSASNARGFTRGNIFTREGKLVASVVQEGMIRPVKTDKP